MHSHSSSRTCQVPLLMMAMMAMAGLATPAMAQGPFLLRAASGKDARNDTSPVRDQNADADAETVEQRAGQILAALGSQPLSPWFHWLTLAAQAEDEDSDIIEISEATRTAIAELDPENQVESGGVTEIGGDTVIGDAPRIDLGEDASEWDEAMGPVPAPEASDPDPMPRLAPVPDRRETTSRNLRKPLNLSELEAVAASEPPVSSSPLKLAAPAPKALSDSMRAVTKEPPLKRTLKSSEEDLQDYNEQENPNAKDVSASRDDRLQGIDAEKAKKPEKVLDDETVPVRAPIVAPESSQKSANAKNPAQMRRMERVASCLDHYLKNPETTTARSPWAVMHAVLPFGAEYELIAPSGRVNAIGWMCHNGLCRTQRMFTPRGNAFVPNVGGGVQGHEGQFLAILAQCQVPLDYPIQIGNKRFTVEDLVRYEMATCRERSELTFKLIGLSYYVDANKQWRANDGKVWSLSKLVQEELAQPVIGAACGGTHRLMGFTFALKQRSLQGQPITGQYLRAARFVEEYVAYTWTLQNPDGSFSTRWYEGRGNDPNEERKVQTSGHMLEWLMFTIGDDELASPRVERAIDFLLGKIYEQREHKWPIGPRGHATRALALYAARLQGEGEVGVLDSLALPAESTVSERSTPERGSLSSVGSSSESGGNRSPNRSSVGTGVSTTRPTSSPQPGAGVPNKSATRTNRRFRG